MTTLMGANWKIKKARMDTTSEAMRAISKAFFTLLKFLAP